MARSRTKPIEVVALVVAAVGVFVGLMSYWSQSNQNEETVASEEGESSVVITGNSGPVITNTDGGEVNVRY